MPRSTTRRESDGSERRRDADERPREDGSTDERHDGGRRESLEARVPATKGRDEPDGSEGDEDE